MRILHISDLHFGNHNANLAESLKDLTDQLKPELILATGDLADQPTGELLGDARDFLRDLGSRCAERPKEDPDRPQVMVVPGNHDVRYLGNLRISAGKYSTIFSERGWPKSYYFQPENVWVYGFDSSLEWKSGANGKVPAKDLLAFSREYARLKNEHKGKFEQAVKIAAIHHHPLPIKYDASVARWLVLTNAAEFLGEVLNLKIDFIVHGHEHVRARVHYGKELEAEGHREIPILSVGTTLKRAPGSDPNCLYIIDLKEFGVVRVDEYAANGNQFNKKPRDSFEVISTAKASERFHSSARSKEGYSYAAVSSIAKINRDGDTFRIVECNNLLIDDPKVDRASSHIVSLPPTTGYFNMPRSSASRGSNVIGLRLTGFKRRPMNGIETGELKIDFGRKLTAGETLSYEYSWYAVNADAMNEREARSKYDPPLSTEFTHFAVLDPIEELTVIAQFPDDFVVSTQNPQPRICKIGSDVRDVALEKELRDSKALHYYEALGTVALRVARPFVGYSYGIEWNIPPSPPAPSGPTAGRVEDLVKAMGRARSNHTENVRNFLRRFLFTVTDVTRRHLINGADEVWEAGLMTFDRNIRRMVVVGAASIGNSIERCDWKDFSKVEFGYGEGIGGKVFKTNQPRLYVKLTEEEENQRTTPNFYLPVEGMPDHSVLLCIPVQNPDDLDHVYAVLSFGALTRTGRFWEIGQPEGPAGPDDLGNLQVSLNVLSFELLSEGFLA
jgi:3',5'-cyclic AMP phosphodiesterase CpdA